MAGTRYRIEVAPTVYSPVNPLLEVYRACDSPPSETRKTLSAGIRYDVDASTAGPVYLRLADVDPQTGGSTAGYAVSVRPISIVTDDPAPAPDALILVAGRYRAGDEVQPNINQVAQAVYDYYLEMDYRADQIYYLTTDSTRNGYDGHPTLENLEQAITAWAPQVLGSDGALTLYLIDHGNADVLYLDNTGERKHLLTAGQLSAWLDELEARIPNIKITIIIEACNSGSFIEGADSISKDRTKRLVITSTNPENVAYASQHGAHFSDFFVAALKQGYSLQNSFRSAFVVVQELSSDWEDRQEPWIDANANGIANEEADITLLSRGIPGQHDHTPADEGAPRIVTAQLHRTSETQQVTIDATVSDDNQIKRVWAVIYPPSYQPPTSSVELIPDPLRRVELQPVGANQVDEGSYVQFAGIVDTLTEAGQYRIAVYAEDEAGFTAVPRLLGINTTNTNQTYLPLILQ
ncbi:MAG: C13 family peptidase [Caldilineaceae bacterium]